MRHKQYYRVGCMILGSLLYGSAMAAAPSASMLANTCAGCHGTNGSSMGPASPTIAGISKDFFIETMEAYKAGERVSTIMSRIAKGYTEEEIKRMAGFFSQQKFVRQPQEHDAQKAKLGKKLHKKYCEKCHEDGGSSSKDDAGILAGQWDKYLRYSMEDFTSGDREMQKKMKKKVESLQKDHGDKGMDALIHYYTSQK
ncbi:MAG: cytochrome c4 [Gammaproteobacteria bacterium]|nr:cytochrome c4 [Gammaproteobacteria bacterium]